jgi:hypothetical protein
MTYIINWSSEINNDTSPTAQDIGKSTIDIADNSVDNSTSIPLTGKGLPNYGEIQQENYIRLLENFASETVPSNPTAGQLWYRTNATIVADGAHGAGNWNVPTALALYDVTAGATPSYQWQQIWPLTSASITSALAVGAATTLVSTDGAAGTQLFSTVLASDISGAIAGTANQVTVTAGANGVTLSLPQSISTTSTPTFSQVTIANSPVNSTDTATKSYVDAHVSGLQWKQAVQVATTANITLSGEQTIDGVTTSSSRVLVKDQTDQTTNGIYTSSTSTWTRTTDANTASQFVGMSVSVTSGTSNAGSAWTQTTPSPITLGTSNIVFVALGSSYTPVAGSGINISGTTFTNTGVLSVAGGTGVSVSGSTGNVTISLATGSIVDALAGTANQILVNGTTGSNQTGNITLSLPQSIAPSSAVTFANVTLGNSGAIIGNAAASYGSLQIGSSTGGYAGIQFTATNNNRTFMIGTGTNTPTSGVYSVGTGTWDWSIGAGVMNGVSTINNSLYINGNITMAAGNGIYPPFQSGQGSGTNTSYYLASSTTYGLFSNTGLYLNGGLVTTGNITAGGNITGNPYVYAQYLNQSSANNENPSISQIMVTNGTDNFLRKASVASLSALIGGQYTPIPSGAAGAGQIITVLDASTSVPYVYTFPTGGTWFYQFYVFAYYESGNWWLGPLGGVFSGVANGGTSIDLYPQLSYFNGSKQLNTASPVSTSNGIQIMGTLWQVSTTAGVSNPTGNETVYITGGGSTSSSSSTTSFTLTANSTQSPSSYTWSVNGPGTLSSTSGQTVTLTTPAGSNTVTCTVNVNGTNYTANTTADFTSTANEAVSISGGTSATSTNTSWTFTLTANSTYTPSSYSWSTTAGTLSSTSGQTVNLTLGNATATVTCVMNVGGTNYTATTTCKFTYIPPCFSGDTRILTEAGYVRFDELPGEFVVVNHTGKHRAKLLVHETDEPMRRMGSNLVTEKHLIQVGSDWVPAADLFHEVVPSQTRLVYNAHVLTDNPDDHHYLLENGLTAHNIKA